MLGRLLTHSVFPSAWQEVKRICLLSSWRKKENVEQRTYYFELFCYLDDEYFIFTDMIRQRIRKKSVDKRRRKKKRERTENCVSTGFYSQ